MSDSNQTFGVHGAPLPELFQGDALLCTLVATSRDCIQVLDREGQILALTDPANVLAIANAAEGLVGKSWLECWDSAERPQVRSLLEAARSAGVQNCELRGAFGSPTAKWWQLIVSPLLGDETASGRLLVVLRDISSRKRSEANLKESEERFETAFEQAATGLIFASPEGVLLRVNPAFCEMVGYSSDELVGRTSAHFTHPEDRGPTAQMLAEAAASGRPIKGSEKRYVRKDGRIVWARFSLSYLRDEQGRPGSLIGTLEDVTEQKEAERQHAETEQNLRLIFESATDFAVFTLSPDGQVTSWNTGAEGIFGYEAAEIVGRDSALLWTDVDAAEGAHLKELQVAREKGRAEDERWHRRKDGSLFFASGVTRPMRNDQEELIGFSKVCRDITHQRQAEREVIEVRKQIAQNLESERARLAEVFERSPSFMAVLRGPDHIFELTNDNYRALVGRPDLGGKTVREALPEVVTQGFLTLLDRVYTTGEEFVGRDVRVLIQRQPGGTMEESFVDFVYRPLRNNRGEIDGIFVHGNDITERKKAERAVQRLSEQRRLALDSAQMGWWQYDMETDLVTGDERFCKIFGVQTPVTPYSQLIAMMEPADGPRVDAAVRAAIRTEDPVPYSIDYRVIHRNGDVRWVRANGQTYYEGEGVESHAVSFVGVVADITEAKLAEEALRESEARFRQLADSMPQIVFQAQPDGHVDYFNRQWYEYTGIKPGEVGYESWRPVHEPAGMERVAKVWPESVRTGKPYEIEYRLRRADGQFRWHLGRALPVKDAEGNIVRWFGTNTDIHDQKQLQEENEQLLASERAARAEAERASHMKDEFLATLSHELRTPLNAIMGWVSILRDNPDASEVAEGVEVIERNARAQRKIIEDLLDMSRIISGKVRLDVQKVALASIVEAAVDTVKPAADAKGIVLETHLDSTAPPISADLNRLQQVFWNLLSNAVKFTPRGGFVSIAMERTKSHLWVVVSDTGEGIRPEFLPHVFGRFLQADASTTRRHGGLGLGLAIVKQLVELHGGSVRVQSEGAGKGATFTVLLPFAPADLESDVADVRDSAAETVESVPPELPTRLNLAGVKILVVDDEPDARQLVGRLLSGCDAEVRMAASAEEALAQVDAFSPHVLVSDIGMPGEDGYSLIRKIRARPPEQGGNLPALALTAYARVEDRMKAVLAGFQMHVAKPVEPAELLTMVASLSGRTAGSSRA